MVEEVAALVVLVAMLAAAISVGLRGTEIISGTREISFLEVHLGMITHTTVMIIRTLAIMTTMLADQAIDGAVSYLFDRDSAV
jgi:hypothetical protein